MLEQFKDLLGNDISKWTKEQVYALTEDVKTVELFSYENLRDLTTQKENPEISAFAKPAFIWKEDEKLKIELTNLSQKEEFSVEEFVARVKELIVDPEKLVTAIPYLILYAILVQNEDYDVEENKEEIRKMISTVVNELKSLEVSESFIFFVDALDNIYRIKEVYFQRTEDELLTDEEIKEIENLSDIATKFQEKAYADFLKNQQGDNNGSK